MCGKSRSNNYYYVYLPFHDKWNKYENTGKKDKQLEIVKMRSQQMALRD